MTALKLIGFSGEVPRVQPRQLPETGAQQSLDCRLENGALVPINRLNPVYDFTGLGLSEVNTIFKFNGAWLAWQAVVNAVPGPVATDRLYYTGDGVPKMMVGNTVYDLKLTAPTAALSGALSGVGTGNVVTLLYVYTRVTIYGEESEPSPISADINWQAGKTVTLSGFDAVPPGRGFTTDRIYRSQTSASGTGLYLIAERAASAADYVDVVNLSDIADPLPSLDYNPPPDDLSSLIALPNGVMAGFSGKQFCLSEPFKPHAWPEKYRQMLDYQGVALGAFGSSVAIATTGMPYVAVGSTPETMKAERIETNLPCINPRSMVDLGYAVAYASHDGLVVASQGAARVVTDGIMTREQWMKSNPGIMVAGQYNGRYFSSYEYLTETGDIAIGTFAIDLNVQNPFLLRYSLSFDASFYDIESGLLYVLIGQQVYEFDSLGTTPAEMTWKSKLFVLPRPDNFGAIYIDGGRELTSAEIAYAEAQLAEILSNNAILYFGSGYILIPPNFSGINGPGINVLQINGGSAEVLTPDYSSSVPAGSMLAEVNGDVVNAYPVNGDGLRRYIDQSQFIAVSVYGDGELVATINKMNTTCRLPANFRARTWEVLVYGNAPIYEINIASTARELRAV